MRWNIKVDLKRSRELELFYGWALEFGSIIVLPTFGKITDKFQKKNNLPSSIFSRKWGIMNMAWALAMLGYFVIVQRTEYCLGDRLFPCIQSMPVLDFGWCVVLLINCASLLLQIVNVLCSYVISLFCCVFNWLQHLFLLPIFEVRKENSWMCLMVRTSFSFADN